MGPTWAPWMLALSGAPTAEKIGLIRELLASPAGQEWRRQAGEWVTGLAPLDTLVPESARQWRPLVADALQFFFSRLSDARLAAKIAEQIEMAADTPPERRLILLISKMPGLQKIGQVLARNRRLAPALRRELTRLENGMSDMSPEEVRGRIEAELGGRLAQYQVELDAGILSEASVSAVMRFSWNNPNREREHGVFKVLKPYVPDCFGEDMALLQELGNYLAAGGDYGFALRDHLDRDDHGGAAAAGPRAGFYARTGDAGRSRAHVPLDSGGAGATRDPTTFDVAHHCHDGRDGGEGDGCVPPFAHPAQPHRRADCGGADRGAAVFQPEGVDFPRRSARRQPAV